MKTISVLKAYLKFCLWLVKEDNETLLRKGRLSKGAKVRKTLDFHDWRYSMFRSTIWGHMNADEEDGSHVHVRNSP